LHDEAQWAEKIVGSGSSASYTFYVGPDFEVQVSDGQASATQYYEFGGQRVAGDFPGAMGTQALEYLHADYLGSTLAATDSSGGLASGQTRYDAYGNDLYGTVGELPTDYDYTAQKLDGTGFYQMGARWYDPYLNQWIQPDTIDPDPKNPQSLNRYSYARNSPLRYNDPSGHDVGCGGGDCGDESLGVADGLADETSWDSAAIYNASPGAMPGWDSEDTAVEAEAQAAYSEFTQNPDYFAGLYASGDLTNRSWLGLDLFAEYSQLHTTPQQLVIQAVGANYGADGITALAGANLDSLAQGVASHAGGASGTVMAAAGPGLAAAARGNTFHYDELNGGTGQYGPSQWQESYPDTIFRFARRGQAGPDVTYVDGTHPSEYPGSSWLPSDTTWDFKPDTVSGARQFSADLRSGKFPPGTQPIWYDPEALMIDQNP
jgi:RHS repeat-associated protein